MVGLYLARCLPESEPNNTRYLHIQLLPSSFDAEGRANAAQRLTCFLIDDRVTVDAGSIGIALNEAQRRNVRDVIVTHPHMDHIASLPIFVDDLFGELEQPIRIHATQQVIDLLKRDVFNDNVYPRFDELKNERGPVMKYTPFEIGTEFSVAHLTVTAIPVNHIVPTVGLLVSDGKATVAFSSDTAETGFNLQVKCSPQGDDQRDARPLVPLRAFLSAAAARAAPIKIPCGLLRSAASPGSVG